MLGATKAQTHGRWNHKWICPSICYLPCEMRTRCILPLANVYVFEFTIVSGATDELRRDITWWVDKNMKCCHVKTHNNICSFLRGMKWCFIMIVVEGKLLNDYWWLTYLRSGRFLVIDIVSIDVNYPVIHYILFWYSDSVRQLRYNVKLSSWIHKYTSMGNFIAIMSRDARIWLHIIWLMLPKLQIYIKLNGAPLYF